MTIAEGLFLGILAGLSVYDIKTKKVPVAAVLLLGIVVLVYRLCIGTSILKLLTGIIPGVALLLVSFCTRESIGRGDGLVLVIIGLFFGFRNTWAVLGMALVFSAVLAILLLVIKRVGRKTTFPFLPCLFAGCFVCVFW